MRKKGKPCKACGEPMTQMITTKKPHYYIWICGKIRGEPLKGAVGFNIYCNGDKEKP